MYAGTTIRRGSGKIVGVHQKIDRAARRHLKKFMPRSVDFPGIRDILHFEGVNGPDGIKRKSPAIDEPWHFIDPDKPDGGELVKTIDDHLFNLAEALKNKNEVRAAFEAAWLAHAVVDGLTPAHHYPLAEKIEELWGKAANERTSIREKNIIHGDNFRDTLSKNWEYWGTNGVFTTHNLFEIGVASAISTDNFKDIDFTRRDISKLKEFGFEKLFLEAVHEVDDLKMFDRLAERGWTRSLARKAKKVLVPIIIKMVILAWYQAAIDSME